jgi:glyoxylase-like metal-dependent hydrolase (beta-lactamase superfamily II)
MTFGSGDNQIVFVNTGGHSAGSSYVYFEAEKVLVTGDLVQVDKYPYFGDKTTDLQAWIQTLKKWHGMNPSVVCPGHGRPVDKDYLRLEWVYFEDLISALTALKDDGVAMEEAVIHPSLPAGYWEENCCPEPSWFKYCIALSYSNL